MIENRLRGADCVRASACLIVVFHHLAQRVDWRADMGVFDFARFFVATGGFGVGTFFVLSGFLLARPFWQALDRGEPMPNLGTYALRRAARILPGFWLALTVSFLVSITVFGLRPDAWLIARYLAGLFLVSDWHWTSFFPVEINGPLWSIGFEVSSYLMLPIGFAAVFALFRSKSKPLLSRVAWLGVIAAALALHSLFAMLVPVPAIGRGFDYGLQGGAKVWMPLFNPFGFFAMFAIGALAGGAQVMLARYRSWLFDLLAVAALAGIAMLLFQQAEERTNEAWGVFEVPYAYPVFQLLVGALLATAPSSMLGGRLLDNPPMRYVARISFGIYVWHMLILELVRVYWMPELDYGALRTPLAFASASVVVIATTFVVAALSFRYIEAPVTAWARRLEPRPSTPTLSPAAG
ncbi:acyltransferase family protein [Devosia nitrariae]|uniref:Acyltransferase n=1 Tax=Devosia nitrariae TaxID=2071872 RepID=A0ABQ5W761_9HYPH|nr:acyltransferase [Devosia nitrariae]GLQ55450.1 acyltransferase [Devosia nitrariae]